MWMEWNVCATQMQGYLTSCDLLCSWKSGLRTRELLYVTISTPTEKKTASHPEKWRLHVAVGLEDIFPNYFESTILIDGWQPRKRQSINHTYIRSANLKNTLGQRPIPVTRSSQETDPLPHTKLEDIVRYWRKPPGQSVSSQPWRTQRVQTKLFAISPYHGKVSRRHRFVI